jgi:hypothetical protein
MDEKPKLAATGADRVEAPRRSIEEHLADRMPDGKVKDLKAFMKDLTAEFVEGLNENAGKDLTS